MRLRRDADAALDVLVLLQHAEAWRNEDAAAGEACGGGGGGNSSESDESTHCVSRLRAACDALRLLAADAAPNTLGVSLWRAGVSGGRGGGRGGCSGGTTVPFGEKETSWAPRLRCLEALASCAAGEAALPPLCAALRRAALALKCRAPAEATVTATAGARRSAIAAAHTSSAHPPASSAPRREAALLLLVCDAGCLDDADVAQLADAAAAVRAAGARIHVVFADGAAASPRAAAARAAFAAAARCGARGQGDCLWPLACDACGCCVPPLDDDDTSPLADDDLSAYADAAAATVADPPPPRRTLSVCEALREAGVLRSGAAALRDAWVALYGAGGDDDDPDDDAPPPFPLPAPPPAAASTAPPLSPPLSPAPPALASSGALLRSGCSEAAAVGEAVLYGASRAARASPRLRPPLREFLRVVLAPPPSEDGAAVPPPVAYTICVDSLARVAEALMTPRAAVRTARLLECFGAAPGALRGQRRLAPEPRASRARNAHPHASSSRIALWLRADGTYELTYERHAAAGAALAPACSAEAPEVLAILPPQPSPASPSSSAASTSSWRAPSVSRIAADPSGRAFALDAGAGAGRRRRFFWLRAAALSVGLDELAALQRALASECDASPRPTLSQLTGVSEEELVLMAAAAPALLTHLLALQAGRPGERGADEDGDDDGVMEPPPMVPSRLLAPRALPPLRGLPPLHVARRESGMHAAPAAVVLPPPLPVPVAPETPPPPPSPPPARAAAWCLGGVDLAESEAEAEARWKRERCCALAQAESIAHGRRTATAAAAAAAAPPAAPATPPPPAAARVKGAVTLSNLRDALQHNSKK
jgi:hypothetical protein